MRHMRKTTVAAAGALLLTAIVLAAVPALAQEHAVPVVPPQPAPGHGVLIAHPPAPTPQHAALPPATMERLREIAEKFRVAFGAALKLLSDNEVELLSGNKTELLSQNTAELLSGNSPKLLSGNRPKVLSENQTPILSGNRISIFSNIKMEIRIVGSGNNNGNPAAPPMGPRGAAASTPPVGR